MVDADVFPGFSGGGAYSAAPVLHRIVFLFGALPDAVFGLYDPVYLAFFRVLDYHPVGVVEAEGSAGFQVVNPKVCSRPALFGGAEGGETENILCLVKELREFSLKGVVGSYEVENGLPRLHRRGEVPSPTERFCLEEAVIGVVEFNTTIFNSQVTYLGGQVAGYCLLYF